MGKGLSPGKLELALASLRAWRDNPSGDMKCPECGAAGLDIADHSARPYTEWYVLTCAACGLDQTLSIPMGPPLGAT